MLWAIAATHSLESIGQEIIRKLKKKQVNSATYKLKEPRQALLVGLNT